jgi:hypothetical protein
VGASAPPEGVCATAVAGITAMAARNGTIRVVRRLMAFSGAYEVS